MPRGATPTARWRLESQPISNQPIGLEFAHHAGRYRPGGSPSSCPIYLDCRYQVYRRVSGPGTGCYRPGVWRDLGVVPRGNSRHTLASLDPAHQQSADVGFPHRAMRHRPEGSLFSMLDLQMYRSIPEPGMGRYPRRVRWDLGGMETGNSCCALAP